MYPNMFKAKTLDLSFPDQENFWIRSTVNLHFVYILNLLKILNILLEQSQ